MSPLSVADFKGVKLKAEMSPFEMLLEVVAVASQKFEKELLEQNLYNIYDDEENSEPNLAKEKVLKQPMIRKCKGKRTKRRNQEPKLMNSAIKALSKVTTVEDDESSLPGTSKGKRKLEDMSNEEWIETMMNKKQKKMKKVVRGPNLGPSLPDEFQREIFEKSGVNQKMATLIIQKRLEKTDLNKNHGRISIPCSRVETFEFLTEKEMTHLRKEGTITVKLIHKPKKNGVDLPIIETAIEMRQWDLHKSKGDPDKVSPQYVLRTAWNKIVLEDGFKIGDFVQIWAFRDAQDKLSMALVKIDE